VTMGASKKPLQARSPCKKRRASKKHSVKGEEGQEVWLQTRKRFNGEQEPKTPWLRWVKKREGVIGNSKRKRERSVFPGSRQKKFQEGKG